MSLFSVKLELRALRDNYTGRNRDRIDRAIMELDSVDSSPAPPSYSSGNYDEAVSGCSDCRPGAPCYGHGHR